MGKTAIQLMQGLLDGIKKDMGGWEPADRDAELMELLDSFIDEKNRAKKMGIDEYQDAFLRMRTLRAKHRSYIRSLPNKDVRILKLLWASSKIDWMEQRLHDEMFRLIKKRE